MHSDTTDWHNSARYFEFAGHQIAYWHNPGRLSGGQNNAGRPLLLIHGFPTCSWDWMPAWHRLAQHHRLIACDMLGFGLSAKPRRGYSIKQQADLQEALLAHLGIGEWDALVHDYGVSVGQELLARQQMAMGAEGLGQVIFLNGGIFPDQHRPRPIQKLGTSPIGFIVSRMLNRASFGKSFSAVFGPNTQPSDAELDAFWYFICHNDGNLIFHKLLHYIAERRQNEGCWVGALIKAQDRIGLINGALDPVSGRHAYDKWREILPQARHYLLPDIGHYPQVEAPEKTAEIALAWLAGQAC